MSFDVHQLSSQRGACSQGSSQIFIWSAALSTLILVLHVLILWAAPFKSIYETGPAILVLIIFHTVFLVCARFMLWLSTRSAREVISTSCDLKNQLFGDHRVRTFILLASLVGISLHVWSKYYLLEFHPIKCFSHIRYAWLQVDRSLLPDYIRLASILGHLLTSFAYLGVLSTSYLIGRAGLMSAVSRKDIVFLLLFMLIGVIYAAFIGSRNAMLAFFVMSLIGLIMGLSSSMMGEKGTQRLRLSMLVLAVPIVTAIFFSSYMFSDRLFCHKSDELIKLEYDQKSRKNYISKTSADYVSGFYSEFSLEKRSTSDIKEWREKLFIDMCPVCAPTMVYVNHGIFNLSKVLAVNERGDSILLNFISAWAMRIGLDLSFGTKKGVRVHGPGGLTLAGAAYHDYGALGLVFAPAVLGLFFGKSISWINSSGFRVLIGICLFSLLSYALHLSFMFVVFGLLPFPFIAFGIGVGLVFGIYVSKVQSSSH